MTNTPNHHHPSAPLTTKNRAHNFSRPRTRLNLDKPLPPLPVLGASHGMAVRRAVEGEQREVVRVREGKRGYARL